MTQTITRFSTTFAALVASAAFGSALAFDEGQPPVEVQNYAPRTPNVEIVVNPVETPAYNYDEMNRSMSVEERQGMTLNPGAGGLASVGAGPFVGGAGAVDDFQDPDLGDDLASLADPSVFEIGTGGGGEVGGSRSRVAKLNPKIDYDKRLKDLTKRKKQLDKELDEARKRYLKTKEGKKTQKKLDDIEKRRKAAKKKVDEEYKKRLRERGPECCTYGEYNKISDWQYKEQDKVDDAADAEREKAIDKGMKKTDPKGQKKYEKARNERKAVGDKLRETRKAKAKADLDAIPDVTGGLND